MYSVLQNEHGESCEAKPFIASKGLFERCKRWHNLHNIKMSSEAAIAETEAACKYREELKEIITADSYTPQRVFNVNETGLFWKYIPARTHISMEEMSVPGFKFSKDCLMLLLVGSAAGDFKVKTLLVCHTENPRVVEGCTNPSLPVI